MKELIMRFMPRGRKSKLVVLTILDIMAIQFSSFMGLVIRFDFNPLRIPEAYAHAVLAYAWIYTICTIVIFFFFHCHFKTKYVLFVYYLQYCYVFCMHIHYMFFKKEKPLHFR